MGNISRKIKRSKKKVPFKIKHINELLKTANVHEQQQQWFLAKNLYYKIISLDPDNHYSLWRLGRIFMNPLIRDYENAENMLEKAVALCPGKIEYKLNLTTVLLLSFKIDQALDISKKILQSDPRNRLALYNMGFALMRKKDLKGSLPYFRRVIQLYPDFDPAYVEIFQILYQLDDKESLRNLLADCENIFLKPEGVKQKTDIKFVLGKYYDLLNEYNTAFRFLSEANAERLSLGTYDIKKDEYIINNIISTCDTQYMVRNEGHGFHDSTPIFILGMPRSGTSLIEQILSSHPEVAAGGELKYFDNLSSRFDYSSPLHFNQLGRDYVEALKKHSAGLPRVTDKMPHNFIYAGLIKLALPDAKIIHCVRDPLDTCFSCFRQGFAEELMLFTCDLDTLGQYYNLYDSLMKHWRAIMPGYMHEVRYENVVSDLTGEIKHLLEYCGLEWSDSCLHYYNSKKHLATASRDQVRQPVYLTSIGRWKLYREKLGKLLDRVHPAQET